MTNGFSAAIPSLIISYAMTLGAVSSALGSPLTSSNPLGLLDVFGRTVDISSGCSTTGIASCHNTSAVSNLCCFESPGVSFDSESLLSVILIRDFAEQGLILQTQVCYRLANLTTPCPYFFFQFWDTDPSTGPTNSWTIHGAFHLHLIRSLLTIVPGQACGRTS